MKNRFFNILVQGVFLPMCLGTVYNFSQYSANIMQCFDIKVAPNNKPITKRKKEFLDICKLAPI